LTRRESTAASINPRCCSSVNRQREQILAKARKGRRGLADIIGKRSWHGFGDIATLDCRRSRGPDKPKDNGCLGSPPRNSARNRRHPDNVYLCVKRRLEAGTKIRAARTLPGRAPDAPEHEA
jgi:hypothetical protein